MYAFAGGLPDVAEQLVPDRFWVAWEFVEPGASCGMAYHGLVWLDGRFAWFPKPWRVLEEV